MIASRWLHTSSLLLDGKVLLTGGMVCKSEDECSTSTRVDSYDPTENTWTMTASMHDDRLQHTASVLLNGKVLVAGGCDSNWQSLNTCELCELYDPLTDEWSRTSSMHDVRVFHTVTVLPSGKVLITGGLYSIMSTDSCELYDSLTGNWTKVASMDVGRREHTATLLMDGQVLITGGLDNSGIPISSCELYNPSTDTWAIVGSMHEDRVSHMASLLPNGKVLVAGGNRYGLVVLNSTELYDPLTGNWTNAGNMLIALLHHTASVLKNGNVLISGGEFDESEFDASNVSMLYSPSLKGFASVDSIENLHLSRKIFMSSNEEVSAADENNFETINH